MALTQDLYYIIQEEEMHQLRWYKISRDVILYDEN